jgi:hypothetical protein
MVQWDNPLRIPPQSILRARSGIQNTSVWYSSATGWMVKLVDVFWHVRMLCFGKKGTENREKSIYLIK